ncbi:MAG: hypothetical protein R2939_09190 [Kofleriaceae bacterium]
MLETQSTEDATDEVARRRRDPQAGNALVLATIALTSLAALGALTVLSVRGGIAATGQERFSSIALYAAESGAAAAMSTLRLNPGWAVFFAQDDGTPNPAAPPIPGNGALPGSAANLFSADISAWYEVEILNNRTDPQYDAIVGNSIPNADGDTRVIIRATGHGPDGALAIIEWDVAATGQIPAAGRPCPGYGQKGMAEDGAGVNDCLTSIDSTDYVVYTPGS